MSEINGVCYCFVPCTVAPMVMLIAIYSFHYSTVIVVDCNKKTIKVLKY